MFATRVLILALPLSLSLPSSLPAGMQNGQGQPSFSEMSLEELMNVEVFSVTRSKGQARFDSPAAIHVITQEDIRRTGHKQEIPELLRTVPGLHVAKITNNVWAVSARGFNGRFNGRQLVLIDGRSIHTPIFSGVIWGAQDLVFEDLEKVEVIRGPGGTMWGINAVNGVINIVSKSSWETQGSLSAAGISSKGSNFETFRYGGQVGENLAYRVYGKRVDHDSQATVGPDFTDDYYRFSGGYRMDWRESDSSSFTFQGDVTHADTGETWKTVDVAAGTAADENLHAEQDDWNVLLRWNEELTERSALRVQAYYASEVLRYPDPNVLYRHSVATWDLEIQHNYRLGEDQELVWGLTYRNAKSHLRGGGVLDFDVPNERDETTGLFLQDSVSLLDDMVTVVLGSKAEITNHGDFVVLPNARTSLEVVDGQRLWASVSRAAHHPSIADRHLVLDRRPLAPGMPIRLLGNHDLDSVVVLAYELGYRTSLGDSLFIEASAFYHDYDDAVGLEAVTPLSQRFANNAEAESYGVESALTFDVCDSWRLGGSYTFLKTHSTSALEPMQTSPKNQASLHSYLDFGEGWSLNSAAYYYDSIASEGVGSYLRFDLGLTWRPREGIEIGLWGQNLLDSKHQEYGPDDYVSSGSSRIEREAYFEVRTRF